MVLCPQCGKDDQIRRVTSIVTEGSTDIRYSDALGTLAGMGSASFQTVLAQRLMPPLKEPKKSDYIKPLLGEPFYKRGPVWIRIISILALFVILVCINSMLDQLTWSVRCGLAILLIILSGFLVVRKGQARETKEAVREAELAYTQAQREYRSAMERWRQMYYCARCDGVFLPGSHLVPVERMIDLLYDKPS